MKKYYFILLGLLVALLYFSYQIYTNNKPLQVIFLDVGQGDSILIQKGIWQILIDGGPSGKTELAKLGKYLPYFDREIDVVIATHPDKDHLAGLVDVSKNYKIGEIVETKAEKDTAIFKEWKDTIDYARIDTIEAIRGDEINMGEARLKIVFPQISLDPTAGDANNDSVVSRLDFGNNPFLFTGDIEEPAERQILLSGEDIDVDFLKIAHHGSKYSTSSDILDAVRPEAAVISVGTNNSYGHPTQAVLDALKARNIEIFRTDERGDIIFTCGSKEKCKVKSEK